MRASKKWIVIYFKAGEVYGPIWEAESKIKPTRWANQHEPEGSDAFKIKQVEEFDEEGYKDSFVKA